MRQVVSNPLRSRRKMIDSYSKSKLYWVLLAGAAARALLFAIAPIRTSFERRPELTSPSTAFRSLKEGVFLSQNGIDPYAGGIFYHSPLYLLFFDRVIPVTSGLLTAFLWITVDIASAITLIQVWRARGPKVGVLSPERSELIALLYLFNPYALATCVARSTTSLDNLFTLAAIAGACNGYEFMPMAILAVATTTSLYPALLLLPLLLVVRSSTNATTVRLCVLAVFFVICEASITALCREALGESSLRRSWGLTLGIIDLTPNVGMWWYFFNEMFDHFRPFFRGVFQLHTLIYVVPLGLRLSDPTQVVLIMVGAIATWKSYPTLGDMALWAGLLSCFPEVLANLRHPLFSLTVHLYTSILLPLLHSLWLLTGSGNANFFYAATMVYGLNATLALADVLSGIISFDSKRRLSQLIGTRHDEVDIVQLNTLN